MQAKQKLPLLESRRVKALGSGPWSRLGAVLALAVTLAVVLTAGAPGAALAQANSPAATGTAKPPPTDFVLPADPNPGESNAERGKSQPGNNAPMWSAVRESGNVPGTTTLPGAEKGVLIQSFVQYPGSRLTTAGEAWRQVRNNWIIPYGGALMLVALLAVGILFWRKGHHGHATNDGHPVIERFTPFERSTHLLNAIAFVALAISGLVMSFGKYLLLPILGSTLFGWLTYALKTLHNFVGPLFVVTLVIFIITYLKDNLPRAADITWISKAGGFLSGKEVPSYKFNAGEKAMFWIGATVLGLLVAASGLVLDKLIPGWGETRGQMQVAHMVHAAAAMLMMAMLVGHIYMALTTRGAIKAMQTGWVDEAWAHEHHELWHDDIKAGRVPARRSADAAPPLGATASPGA